MSDTDAHDFPTADVLSTWLPQYQVHECLSEGQEGAVYRADQTALDRTVLIRLLPEPSMEEATVLLARLRQRARLLHPSLQAVYDFGRTHGGPLYLVTEYVQGELLEGLVTERKITPKAAFPLALQLCDALQIIHDHGSVHGALNPRTVLVTQEGLIKLTGMGMAVSPEGELSWLQTFTGSLTQDLHDLGVTLHFLFARVLPGADGRVSRDLPPAFARVLRLCLEPEMARPYRTAKDVQAALTEALRAEQQTATTSTKSKVVIAPGKPAAPASAKSAATPTPVSRPPPGPPRPVMPPTQVHRSGPTFFQKLDAFFWNMLNAGLHMIVTLVSLGSLFALIYFKDHIVIEHVEGKPAARDTEVEEPPIPAAVMGALPPAPTLPTAPTTVNKPISLPLPPAPVDPFAELRAQYLGAVQKAASEALEKVRLDDLPHLQRELTLLQQGGDPPEVDEANLPASLKALRKRYREVRAGKAGTPPQP